MPVLALTLVAGAGLAIGTFQYFERILAEKVGQHYAASLRIRLFKHMARVSARDVAARRNGSLALRFVGDLTAVRGWVSMGLARMISALIVLPAATGVLFYMNPEIGMAASAPVVIGLGVSAVLGPRLGPVHKRLRARRARLAADMSERIPHAPELRLMGRIQTETRGLKQKTDNLISAALERARGAALLRAIPDVVSGIAAASVFWIALQRGLPAADAAGSLAAVGLMIQPMRNLTGVWDRHRAWRNAREKCAALLEMPKLNTARTADVALRDAPPALTARERRRTIALIGTRSPILKGSLRRALIMGVQTRPEDSEILARADAFGLGRVIARLGGLDGRVSEGGRNLSAGEIRRVLLTRAALSKLRLMLLDEPDDALDQDGPELVRALVQGCSATTLLITHNLQIAMMMDMLWLVEDGRVTQTGTPDCLLAGLDTAE